MLMSVVSLMGIAFLVWRWKTSPQRKVDRWLQQIRRGEKPDVPIKTDFDFDLVQTADGFEIQPLKGQTDDVVSVIWQRVVEAKAYKRDLWSTDQVCIAFIMDDRTVVEVHEEMRGFADLCETLPAALPGAMPFSSWYMRIVSPAFEPCLTPLFTRQARSVS